MIWITYNPQPHWKFSTKTKHFNPPVRISWFLPQRTNPHLTFLKNILIPQFESHSFYFKGQPPLNISEKLFWSPSSNLTVFTSKDTSQLKISEKYFNPPFRISQFWLQKIKPPPPLKISEKYFNPPVWISQFLLQRTTPIENFWKIFCAP